MANQTLTNIFSRALNRIGARQNITDATSDTTPAVAILNDEWPATKDMVLADGEWSCATYRQYLTRLSEPQADTMAGSVYTYRYELPINPFCLRPISISNPSGAPIYGERGGMPAQYEVLGRELHTDFQEVLLKYVRRIKDDQLPNLDAHLFDLFAVVLAAKVAVPLKGNSKLAELLMIEYNGGPAERYDGGLLGKAKIADSQGKGPTIVANLDLVWVRDQGTSRM